MPEQTLILFKPDALDRQLVGTILQRYESKGLQIRALKLIQVTEPLAKAHYAEHEGKPFFKGLIAYITAKPIIAMVLEGHEAVKVARAINGATNPVEAAPGSIRGDLALSKTNNLVHASDSPTSATREINLYFKSEEILAYTLSTQSWFDVT